MYSSNPSYESLKSVPLSHNHSRFYQSSVNPNLSTSNLQNLSSKHSSLLEPTPKKFAPPITPPVSNAGTPVSAGFDVGAWGNGRKRYVAVLCVNWYVASVVSNYTTKMILTDFKHPTTLTQVQFVLNCVLGLATLVVALRRPSVVARFPKGTFPAMEGLSLARFCRPDEFVLRTTVPMGMFQFAGHLTSHSATSVIPVSMNHTVKALSPITTVLIYRGVFNKKYKLITYLTLSPLMVGIMLTCYKGQNAHPGLGYYKGIAYSLVSMMIFVTQNIFAKSRLTVDSAEVLPANASRPERKLDKLSILYFCSLTGFVFTLPVYLISEYTNPRLSLLDMNAFTAMLVAVNGVSHYVQSLLAFQILGLISPINYSIANISKRIIIILVAFVIEGKRLNVVQVLGVMLTCTGLFAYDQYGSR